VPFKFELIADVGRFLSGTRDVEGALEDVAEALDDLGDESSDASKALRDDLDRIGDEADDAADKTKKSFKDAFDSAKRDASDAGRRVGKELDDGFDRAERAADEFKDEAGSVGREAATSFSGEFEDVTDVIRDIAANAFQGFGPAGAAAGVVAAAGLGVLVAQFEQFEEDAEAARDRVTSFAQAIVDAGGDVRNVDIAGMIREWGYAADDVNLFERLGNFILGADVRTNFERFNDLVRQGAFNWEELATAMAGTDHQATAEALEEVNRLLEAERDALREFNAEAQVTTDTSAEQVEAWNQERLARQANVDMLEDAREELQNHSREQERAIDLAGIETDAVEETTAALDAKREAQDALRESLTTLIGSENDYYEAVDKANDIITANGENWSAASEEGRQNRDAVLGAAEAMRNLTQAQIDSGTPIDQVRDNLADQRDELYALAIQAGATKTEARNLVDTMLGTPSTIETTYTTNLDEVTDRVNKYRPPAVSVPVRADASNLQADVDRAARNLRAPIVKARVRVGQEEV
jgi:hypothetical protein